MISFLARFFIKDHEQVDSPIVRQSYGMLSGAFGIAFNILLVIFKMIAGVLSGSIAVFSDALNNLSDVTSSVVTLVFFKLSGREADEEHPFGHGRLEYVAGLIVSLLIIIMAVELLNGSIMKIIHPEDVEFSFVIVLILVVSIFIKFIMFYSYMQTAKLIDSATIRSAAIDSLSDVLSTSIVLISLIVFEITGKNVDGYAGMIVALFIFKTGIDSAKDTINPLLGEPPSKDFLREIERTVLTHECVLGVHDIVVHNYGPSRVMMSLHVEVSSDETLINIHDSIDEIEKELRQKYHCTAVIHMDPVDSSDSEAMAIKSLLTLNIEEIDPSIKFHDLRIVRKEGEKPVVEFDLEVPYRYKMADDELVKLLEYRLREIGEGYSYDITVDKKEK
ncbi:MAG: cation transporter [Butyrivibrio sp.]|nr:cation diffusion facilitator family transporter [Butyrivibrio sp.]MBR1642614.1 cation transporter [Butyrivibrio sp.]